jgi:hypothetical protein
MNRFVLFALFVLAPLPGFAQTPAKPPTDVAVTPIECWWKADRSAIRVGERFNLTLTCAVLDTDNVKVVVDESSLAPSALHLVPFEVVGGQRFRDIRNSPRRFFQYQYVMRVLGEDFFGKEVTLPRLQLSYRVQNALSSGSALSGREELYSLRPVPIRVASLVPKDAADIRDTPPDTFGDVDARLFHSNLLLMAGGVGLVLAALLVVVVLVRATAKRRATASVQTHLVSPSMVLRAASRELSAVRAASQQGGWSGELAGRAAAALRLAGAIALGSPVSQRDVDRGVAPAEGQVTAGGRWRRKKLVVSAAVTPATVALNSPSSTTGGALWEGISQQLGLFSAVRYSRPSTGTGRDAGPDGTALDTALAESQDLVKRLWRHRLLRAGRLWRSTPVLSGDADTSAKPTWAR